MSVEMPMIARISWRNNSLSYSDDRKSSETLDIEGISARNRWAIAYFGFNGGNLVFMFSQECNPPVQVGK